MRSLSHFTTPACLTSLACQRPNGPWFDNNVQAEVDCRRETRRAQLANQHSLCAWCEQTITLETSHTDHIEPKSGSQASPHLTFSSDNLLASCGKSNSETCGHAKKDSKLASWVHPYNTSNLQSHFSHDPTDGKLNPSTSANVPDAQDAIDKLNLNHRPLREKRENFLSQLNTYANQGFTLDDIRSFMPAEFPSLLEEHAHV